MSYVCPFCQQHLSDAAERCFSCGEVFTAHDWPQEAYSAKGMIPHISLSWSDNRWEPNTSDFIIGREPGFSGLQLSHPTISRKHLRLYIESGEWRIQKLNKSFLLNQQETEDAVLAAGDKIILGPVILSVSINYKPVLSSTENTGCLQSSAVEQLDKEKVYIGSDPSTCRVIIKKSSPQHALIYRQSRSGNWWVADCASDSGTRVNNERVRNERLFQGDRITVAGVGIIFQGDKLLIGKPISNGLSVSLENVSVTRNGFDILQDVSFHVKEGEFVGVLGPSGCGKSSLIQRIVGLDSFDNGSMKINGTNYKEIKKDFHRLTSYLPQQVALHEDLTLAEEVGCFCRLHTDNQSQYLEKSKSILKLVGLENEVSKRVGDLSGGQQRRAGIALELLRNPQLLVLDEPTAGLDPATETEIMTYLRRIANQNKTVICSTHIVGNMRLFDKVLLLVRGRVVFFGSPVELLDYFNVNHPQDLYRLMGKGNTDVQDSIAKDFAAQFEGSPIRKKDSVSQLATPLNASPVKNLFFSQIYGYLHRMGLEALSFKNTKHSLRSFFGSSLFIQLIFQPILVAMVIKLSCAYKMWSNVERKEVFFFCAIAVFWLGLNSAIRELVKERIPWRCLERLEQVSLSAYLSGKILWTMLMSFLQVIVFSAFFYGIPEFKVAVTKPGKSMLGSMAIIFVLFAVCTMGAWIALAISAIFKRENSAVGLLPIILIPVLFFSQPIIQNNTFGNRWMSKHPKGCKCNMCPSHEDVKENNIGNGHFSQFAVAIERVMPCYEPQVLMDIIKNSQKDKDAKETEKDKNAKETEKDKNAKETEKDKNAKETEKDKNAQKNLRIAWPYMLRNTGLYMFFALLIMIIFQYKNEKEWEGR
jgi:ABC transport system ATP-binding/permease protein